MTNQLLRLIRKQVGAQDSTLLAQTETSAQLEKTSSLEFKTDANLAQSLDLDELDLSQIKLPDDFEALLEAETASNFVAPPPTIYSVATLWGGAIPLNEIRAEFSLDSFQHFSDSEYWDIESDLHLEGEGLSSDYIDFLLSYE